MKNLLYSIFICLAFVGSAFGQIEIPSEVPLGNPIVATIRTNMPDGAMLDGGWNVGQGIKFIVVDKDTIHIWVKTVGTYSLGFSGFWIHLKETTFKDGDGNVITIQSYLGHGTINESVEFKVVNGNGPDPPLPPGKRQIMMFYDGDQLDNYPTSQRQILTSLTLRQKLREQGHVLLEILERSAIDQSGLDEQKQIWVNAAKGQTLPIVAFAPKDGGKIVVHPLPTHEDSFLELLNKG